MALDVGASKALTVTVLPVGAPQAVVWQSQDEQVAKVSLEGLVEAIGAGTCDVTATTLNGISAVCKVTVRATEP
ncbi:hypothetical protein UNOSLW1_0175 [Pseudomonas phage UNO-SLW1]|uniref:BIG2 domain-containing protein n=1 Tax=Pseudomonas phage UNO-SLW1 TaxID=1873993 RepID=A0A1B2ANA7_9CAUD|nr:structural protein with Ig domain [Pseudomonas phage UNO-SLW1]ANY29190.1 hypothetical protein UNOSLW1_0175 [Pseudomonas phage UNO-SLW1]